VDLEITQSYRVPDSMREEYAPGIDEVSIENFFVEVPARWEPTLNEEHDEYRWVGLADAIALAHWPETAEIFALLGQGKVSS
jgi:8-oxo-dGTP pyrophosphatase MutT (NUDIX family)